MRDSWFINVLFYYFLYFQHRNVQKPASNSKLTKVFQFYLAIVALNKEVEKNYKFKFMKSLPLNAQYLTLI